MRHTSARTASLLLVIAVGLTGCGDDDTTPLEASNRDTATTSTTAMTTTASTTPIQTTTTTTTPATTTSPPPPTAAESTTTAPERAPLTKWSETSPVVPPPAGIEFRLRAPAQRTWGPEDRTTVTVALTNRSDAPYTLYSGYGGTCDGCTDDAGPRPWLCLASDDGLCVGPEAEIRPTVSSTTTIQPGDTYLQDVTADSRSRDGSALPPGVYRLFAAYETDGGRFITDPIDITITG